MEAIYQLWRIIVLIWIRKKQLNIQIVRNTLTVTVLCCTHRFNATLWINKWLECMHLCPAFSYIHSSWNGDGSGQRWQEVKLLIKSHSFDILIAGSQLRLHQKLLGLDHYLHVCDPDALSNRWQEGAGGHVQLCPWDDSRRGVRKPTGSCALIKHSTLRWSTLTVDIILIFTPTLNCKPFLGAKRYSDYFPTLHHIY